MYNKYELSEIKKQILQIRCIIHLHQITGTFTGTVMSDVYHLPACHMECGLASLIIY